MVLPPASAREGKEAAGARCDAALASGIAACSARGPEAAVHRFGRFAAAAMRGGDARRLRALGARSAINKVLVKLSQK